MNLSDKKPIESILIEINGPYIGACLYTGDVRVVYEKQESPVIETACILHGDRY